MDNIDAEVKYYIHCAGGYRSVIFESIMKARGIHNFVDVLGGFDAVKNNDSFKITEFVCPSTLS
jgi:rhodanese-related sulfurtransferase